MTKKQVFELLLKTAGFEMKNYEVLREGSSVVGYAFEAHMNGKCGFEVSAEDFESAVAETLDGIYRTEGLVF